MLGFKMNEDLIERFHQRALQVYEEGKRATGYRGTRYLQKVRKDGGLKAAKSWLKRRGKNDAPTGGFLKLVDFGRLDVSLEAQVIQEPWASLFTQEELAVARDRLARHGYFETQTLVDAVDKFDLNSIAAELNTRARTHPIGMLQDIRTNLKQLSHRPGQDIFSSQTIHDDWAFHHGGRSELQFNIGVENVAGVAELRHGVAFSFETSRTLPSINVLIPKVRLFNDFIRLYPELYCDMQMWHYQKKGRSVNYMPIPIPPEHVKEGIFVFLGKCQPIDQIDHEKILRDFDRLLPLYRYVESGGDVQPISAPTESEFVFRSGRSIKALSANATHVQKQLDITLRHNELQEALHSRLVSAFGVDNVVRELASGVGTFIDVGVRRPNGYWFYEIKTTHSPRACIREAIGQLLEYSFWPGAQEATRLVVVGETACDHDGQEYLRILKERFSLPIDYEQIVL